MSIGVRNVITKNERFFTLEIYSLCNTNLIRLNIKNYLLLMQKYILDHVI